VFLPKLGAVLLPGPKLLALWRFAVSIAATENDIAAHAVLYTMSATYAGHGAAILAISFNTALAGK
jgi:hypothetical protein